MYVPYLYLHMNATSIRTHYGTSLPRATEAVEADCSGLPALFEIGCFAPQTRNAVSRAEPALVRRVLNRLWPIYGSSQVVPSRSRHLDGWLAYCTAGEVREYSHGNMEDATFRYAVSVTNIPVVLIASLLRFGYRPLQMLVIVTFLYPIYATATRSRAFLSAIVMMPSTHPHARAGCPLTHVNIRVALGSALVGSSNTQAEPRHATQNRVTGSDLPIGWIAFKSAQASWSNPAVGAIAPLRSSTEIYLRTSLTGSQTTRANLGRVLARIPLDSERQTRYLCE
ncbi:hypothetical protein CHU98_g10672 [Xylaria longipes]|nr:hypothetical protein CHU98_g10672 [Xylaria longipes]